MRNSFRRGTMPFKNALAIKYIALYSKYFTLREFRFVNIKNTFVKKVFPL